MRRDFLTRDGNKISVENGDILVNGRLKFRYGERLCITKVKERMKVTGKTGESVIVPKIITDEILRQRDEKQNAESLTIYVTRMKNKLLNNVI